MNNLTKNIYRRIVDPKCRIWILSMSFCIINLPIMYSQCYTTVGNNLTFSVSGQNTNTSYSTLYLLTDYNGNILATSTTNSFPADNAGLFKVFGLNYLTSAGIQNIDIGDNVIDVSSTCFDISEPFEVVICPPAGATCQTFDGQYTFNSPGGNTANTTVYVLTTLDQTISQISTTPTFSGLAVGEYLIFPVNYNDISGLTIGENFHNLAGNCFDVGNPLLIKSCQNCLVSLGEDIDLCQSQPIVLTSSSGTSGTYSWSTGQTGNSIMITPTQNSQTYAVTFTNSEGCIAQDEIIVNILGNPVSNAGEDQTICNGEEATLIAENVPGASYLWSTGETSQSILVSPATTQTYSLTVTEGDCFSVSDINVTVNNLPVVNIDGTLVICNGTTTTLTASGGGGYSWSNGSTTLSITVSPTATTTYTVTVNDTNSCSATKETIVTVNNCGKIGNFVWEDLNANGIQDTGEPGIEGVQIVLFKNGIQVASTFTDPSGMYLFSDLGPGDYVLMFNTPEGFISTVASQGNEDNNSDVNATTSLTIAYTINGSYNNLDVDAGYYKLANLGNYVWEDINQNGIQDGTEPAIENVQVILNGTTSTGEIINQTTYTDVSGIYMFSNLIPGSYTVTFVKPNTDYTITNMDMETDDGRDSDANPTSGVTEVIELTSGENNLTVDAGMYRCSNIGGFVWLDSGTIPNVQDSGDVGLNDVVIELYSSSNPTVPIQTVQTTNNPIDPSQAGYYNFEVCEVGNYFIKVLADLTLYNWVPPNQGNSDALDSDIIDFENQTSLVFTVGYGMNIDDIDAGLKLIPLPVKLTEFSGSRDKEHSENDLWWVTASEINNDFFILERSVNGSPFVEIATIDGAGNSNSTLLYEFVDINSKQSGTYVYRLIQTDFDGRTEVFGPVTIKVVESADINVKLYPNPSINTSFLEINTPIGAKIEGHIFDAAGKLVGDQLFDKVLDDGYISYRLDAQSFAEGVYNIRLIIDGNVKTLRWIVIN